MMCLANELSRPRRSPVCLPTSTPSMRPCVGGPVYLALQYFLQGAIPRRCVYEEVWMYRISVQVHDLAVCATMVATASRQRGKLTSFAPFIHPLCVRVAMSNPTGKNQFIAITKQIVQLLRTYARHEG